MARAERRPAPRPEPQAEIDLGRRRVMASRRRGDALGRGGEGERGELPGHDAPLPAEQQGDASAGRAAGERSSCPPARAAPSA